MQKTHSIVADIVRRSIPRTRVFALQDRRNLRLQHPHRHGCHESVRDRQMLPRLCHPREHEARRHFRKVPGKSKADAVRPADDCHGVRFRWREVAQRGSETEEDLHDYDDGVDEAEECAQRAGPVVFAEGPVNFEA